MCVIYWAACSSYLKSATIAKSQVILDQVSTQVSESFIEQHRRPVIPQDPRLYIREEYHSAHRCTSGCHVGRATEVGW